jgi:hypothetical protein
MLMMRLRIRLPGKARQHYFKPISFLLSCAKVVVLRVVPSKSALRAESSATVSSSSLSSSSAVATVAARLPSVATMSLGCWVSRSRDSKVDVTAADDCDASTTNGYEALPDPVCSFLVGSFFERLVGLLDAVVAAFLRLGDMMKSCAMHALVWWPWPCDSGV